MQARSTTHMRVANSSTKSVLTYGSKFAASTLEPVSNFAYAPRSDDGVGNSGELGAYFAAASMLNIADRATWLTRTHSVRSP